MTILDEIVAEKRKDVAAAKEQRSLKSIVDVITPASHRFFQAITCADWALIAECKLASPTKGTFPHGKTVGELAGIYAAHGATNLSVLTDKHFNGCLEHITEAKKACQLPVLRKDFVVDPYQIYEARTVDADAILLIAAVLSDAELVECLQVADELKMDCLVEVHTLTELNRVLKTSAQLIGINNRDLNTFVTDINTTKELLAECDKGRLIISESGIKTADDALALKSWGVKGILVGEGLVMAGNIPARTQELALES